LYEESDFDVDLNEQGLTTHQITGLLFRITGHQYTVATASNMLWGENGKILTADTSSGQAYCQIVSTWLDKGFFDWYCYVSPYKQLFETKENAFLHFIHNWILWNSHSNPENKELNL
jgi:hypothetical protein